MKRLLPALVLMFFASVAGATDLDQSHVAFRRGVTCANAGDYMCAEAAFLEAHRLYPHPSILLNIGLARSKNGKLDEAERDLTQFLAEDSDAPPEDIQNARAELAAIRQRLGTVRVRVQPAGARVTLDGKLLALVPNEWTGIRAIIGSHKLAVEMEEYDPQTRAVEVSSTPSDVEVTLMPLPRIDHPAPPEPNKAAYVGWSLVGLGGGTVALGVGFGLMAVDAANAYNTPSDPAYQDPKKKETGVTYRTLSDVCIISGAVLAAAGIVVLLVAPSMSKKVAILPSGVALKF